LGVFEMIWMSGERADGSPHSGAIFPSATSASLGFAYPKPGRALEGSFSTSKPLTCLTFRNLHPQPLPPPLLVPRIAGGRGSELFLNNLDIQNIADIPKLFPSWSSPRPLSRRRILRRRGGTFASLLGFGLLGRGGGRGRARSGGGGVFGPASCVPVEAFCRLS